MSKNKKEAAPAETSGDTAVAECVAEDAVPEQAMKDAKIAELEAELAEAKAAKAAEEPPPYQIPSVGVGQLVVYYPHCDRGTLKICGRVTCVGHRTIECVCEFGGSSLAKYEVRHVSDPDLRWNNYFRERGSWDYSDETLRLNELEARVKALEAK